MYFISSVPLISWNQTRYADLLWIITKPSAGKWAYTDSIILTNSTEREGGGYFFGARRQTLFFINFDCSSALISVAVPRTVSEDLWSYRRPEPAFKPVWSLAPLISVAVPRTVFEDLWPYHRPEPAFKPVWSLPPFFERWLQVSQLVGALSPVNHKGLYQGWGTLS